MEPSKNTDPVVETEHMTVKQYCQLRGIEKAYVLKLLAEKKSERLPGVTGVSLFPGPGQGFYMLTVKSDYFKQKEEEK